MDKKVKAVAIACMMLLFSLAFAVHPGSSECVTTPPRHRTVEYDFYVVAGCNCSSPSLPTAEPQPSEFTFTFINETSGSVITGADFGSVWVEPDTETYPAAIPSMQEPVILNVTNNLGYDVIIQDLTVEITAGTRTLPYYFAYPGGMWGNFSSVQVDVLDRAWDEVNYYTGDITFCTDVDVMCMMQDGMAQENKVYANGTDGNGDGHIPYGPSNPEGMYGVGSLLEADMGGDARATGHVAPVQLAADGILTEYMGLWVGGNQTECSKIRGTLTVRVTYKPVQISLDADSPFTGNPVGKLWNSSAWNITDWTDTDVSTDLTVSDQIELTEQASGNASWWHVDDRDPDSGPVETIVVTEKVCQLQVIRVEAKYRNMVIDTAYKMWTINVEVEVKNLGTVDINCTINLYYQPCTACSNWVQIGSSKSVTDLSHWTHVTKTWSWNLAGVNHCHRKLKVNGTCQCDTMICSSFEFLGHIEQTWEIVTPYSPVLDPTKLKVAKLGNVDGDGVVGIGDTILEFFWGNVPPKAPKFDLDDDGVVGIGDVIVSFLNWGDENCQ